VLVRTAPAITREERKSLTEYGKGYVDGMWAYAWWKDGTAYVGTTGRTYAQAVDEYLRVIGKR